MSGFVSDLPGYQQGNLIGFVNVPLQVCRDFEYGICKTNNEQYKIVFHFNYIGQTKAGEVLDFVKKVIAPWLKKIPTIAVTKEIETRFGGALEIFSNWDIIIFPFTKSESERIQLDIVKMLVKEFGDDGKTKG